jgi:23S rRNA (guanosine2251-2'-O)-methyltransferase
LIESIRAGVDITKVMAIRGSFGQLLDDALKACRESGIPVQFVPRERFDFIREKNHQGVCGFISPISYHQLDLLIPKLFEEGKDPFLLILDRVTDVRNLGAIARTAYCAGVDAIVIPKTDAAPVNEDAIKTSAGALLKIPVCREAHLKTTMEYLNQSGFNTIACTEKAKDRLSQTDMSGPIALVMGNEESGISPELLKRCTYLAKIPMDFGVSSLNVSVAAGIAMYEALEQRRPSRTLEE